MHDNLPCPATHPRPRLLSALQVSNGVVGSAAFAAYDAGMDVWLGNARSNAPRLHVGALPFVLLACICPMQCLPAVLHAAAACWAGRSCD